MGDSQLKHVARSYLFVPATRIDRLVKAISLSVDEIIVDLEDAVGEADKTQAREALSVFHSSRCVLVRVNAIGTEHYERDVAFCDRSDWVSGIVLPKVRSVEDIGDLKRLLTSTKTILALVETPQGIVAAREIAMSGVSRLIFGSVDYSASLGVGPSDELLAYPRSHLVVASSVAGLPAPIDGPTLEFRDHNILTSQLRVARALGMGGKLCIHPSQVPFVRRVFQFSESEKEWATEVLSLVEHRGGAVFAHKGVMIDAPVIAQARYILEQ